MEIKERYVVFWAYSLFELKALHEITKAYLKNGQCFTCIHSQKDECNDYPLVMFTNKRHFVPFGQKIKETIKFVKFLLSKSDRVNYVLLFDNIKRRLIVYRTENSGKTYKETLLPHLFQEYNLLFETIPFSDNYELYDLRNLSLRNLSVICNLEPEEMKKIS